MTQIGLKTIAKIPYRPAADLIFNQNSFFPVPVIFHDTILRRKETFIFAIFRISWFLIVFNQIFPPIGPKLLPYESSAIYLPKISVLSQEQEEQQQLSRCYDL